MRKLILISELLLLGMALFAISSTSWNQYYFRFELLDKTELTDLSSVISIDNIRGNWVYAYANDTEWEAFGKLGYRTQLLPSPASEYPATIARSQSEMRSWDAYPTYDAYVAMMNAFATSYPGLCQIVNVGTTVNGRQIIFAKISDNVSSHEAEPELMYSGTMHGDELVGYVLLLRLIDSLLSGYGTDPRITNLVNNAELWICPNTNPDGTYYGGNSTVASARRYNANGIDLNRNFPNQDGSLNSGAIQVETQIIMDLYAAHNFAFAANFHGGSEVVNYPWDYTYSLHPDDDWYISSSLAYASSAQANGPANYFTDINSNGITNGAAWYVIAGGKQDWTNYTAHSREVTIELSLTKLPNASTLPSYWNYNYDALLALLEQGLYGVHGIVKDAYGNPLEATITVNGHDTAVSVISTDHAGGDFYRYLNPGTYSLTVSTAGYPDEVIDNVIVNANQKTSLNITFGEVAHQQQIVLNPGWNLISFNIDLGSNSLASVFDAGLIQIKTQDASYAPEVAPHFSTMSQLKTATGYWENNSSGRTITIQGDLLDSGRELALQSGWNLVPYLPDTAMSVSSALASVSAQVEEVRSLDQSWTPTGGTLSQLNPGKAYWILVSNPCTLIYP
ncbi:MAG: M14 family zinc carboxypeptidase [Candidatus Cloacimonadota bacterium]